MRLAALIPALAIPGIAGAEFRLELPIDCDQGRTCYIQQFVDRDPGTGATDFKCGPLVYDGHKGTDFALPSLAALAEGVDVLAAAPGVIAGVRDGMADALQTSDSAPDVEGRECGNGVVIDHADGWQTQYCHLQMGSVTVATGQTVMAGDVLGQVGLSGQTQFPHVHLAVRQDGVVIDPFNTDETSICGGPVEDTLWTDPPYYLPGGLLQTGFATAVPEFDAIKAGLPPATLARNAPLIVWGHLFGGQAGDTVRIVIMGPEGELLDHEHVLTRTQAQLFRAAGRRAPSEGWPTGRYRGTVALFRADTMIHVMRSVVQLD